MSDQERMVMIHYETIDGKKHEVRVPESQVEERMNHLRSLPDVKAHTVRQGM